MSRCGVPHARRKTDLVRVQPEQGRHLRQRLLQGLEPLQRENEPDPSAIKATPGSSENSKARYNDNLLTWKICQPEKLSICL